MRVYEFSKQHGLSNKDVLEVLRSNGLPVASHMAQLSDDAYTLLKKHFTKATESPVTAPTQTTPPASSHQNQVVPEQKPEPKELRTEKRTPGKYTAQKQRIEINIASAPKVAPEPEVFRGVLTIEPMTVGDFAERTLKPVSEVIIFLLRQGVAATKNQLLSPKMVVGLAAQYGIQTAERQTVSVRTATQAAVPSKKGKQESRHPVVVVIGHVDHGKTTLLDVIRKTRVASREKGGITQHLGAYQAHTSQGDVVFLDTPGHEAFSMMRGRGVRAADIAVLVVAADDGVMPQTIEAIKTAQAVNIPIIVAINKVDKASPAQIETVKRSLAQYDLVPEEWGGQTIMVPISAKLNTGVDALLEVLVLQAQMMELTTRFNGFASGFVLESKIEKGLGPVATVICQEGTVHVGDFFVGGSTYGKVSALIDSFGMRVREVGPSIPVQVSGFNSLVRAGDTFTTVATLAEAQQRSEGSAFSLSMNIASRAALREGDIPIIIKTDGAASQEALIAAVQKLSQKGAKSFAIVATGVGAVTERVVDLAADTGADIYGLHVKVEPNALLRASRKSVDIKLFDVIYKMLEDLELRTQAGKQVKKVLKKIGEATVVKVFDIKNLGVIAGAQVISGRFTKEGKVAVWRGRTKIGEGPISSLQRERKSVKEVHTGFDCGFMIEGFNDFQIDDRVECYLEVAE